MGKFILVNVLQLGEVLINTNQIVSVIKDKNQCCLIMNNEHKLSYYTEDSFEEISEKLGFVKQSDFDYSKKTKTIL